MKFTVKQWFDELVARSKSGKFPASDEDGGCMYRTPEGLKCAVGVLYPDDFVFRSEFGSDRVYADLSGMLDDCKGAWDFIPDGVTPRHLRAAQAIHDRMAVSKDGWDHDRFVRSLQGIDCFRGMTPPA